jgi:hypothetical protein
MKLVDTEKEADKARKDSKLARLGDHFNDVKMRRFVLIFFLTIKFWTDEPAIICLQVRAVQ